MTPTGGAGGGRSPRWRRDRVVVSCAVVVLGGVLFGVISSLSTGETPPAGTAQVVDLSDAGDLDEIIGRTVSADGARVESVPADEGFWIDTDGGRRAWVQVATTGESPFTVEPGARVTFTGEVVGHGTDFAGRPDFPAADVEDLLGEAAHIEVDIDDLQLR